MDTTNMQAEEQKSEAPVMPTEIPSAEAPVMPETPSVAAPVMPVEPPVTESPYLYVSEPEKKKSYKGFALVLGLVAFFFGALAIAEFALFRMNFNNAVSETKLAYDEARAAYEVAHYDIVSNQKKWEAQLQSKQDEVNKANEEMQALYDERQAEWDAEETRWNALTPNEQRAEQACRAYNEMVSNLRASNSEYAEIYVALSDYLFDDIFNIGKDKAEEYARLYSRKKEIEQEYLEKHPLNLN